MLNLIQHLQILRSREIPSQSRNDYRFFVPHRNDASFKVSSLRRRKQSFKFIIFSQIRFCIIPSYRYQHNFILFFSLLDTLVSRNLVLSLSRGELTKKRLSVRAQSRTKSANTSRLRSM